jgi:hypothetical protein
LSTAALLDQMPVPVMAPEFFPKSQTSFFVQLQE